MTHSNTNNRPPHDLNAEKSVIGSILLNPDVLETVRALIGPADFFDRVNAAVFLAALDCWEADEPVDAVTIGERLEANGKMGEVGGEAALPVPIFSELRPLLEAAFDEALEGAEYVIHRYRDTNANLRTQLVKIIKRAGLKPWPKLFHNLRATRQTELAEQFPSHVVCEWIGNSKAVAHEHYLQVTDDHYQRAAYALQSGAESGGIARNGKTKNAIIPAKQETIASGGGPCWTRTSDLSDVNRAL